MKRKIEQTIASWQAQEGHKPLVIKGCRQCGKTYSVLAYVKQHYRHVVYIDFHREETYKALFEGSLELDSLLMKISTIRPNIEFVPHETCFVFDEIQECPRARAALKYFYMDGRFDCICTGSLLGVNGYNSSSQEEDTTPIPVGYEYIIEMYPMDFEEFLWANGISEQVVQYLRSALNSLSRVEEAIHLRMRELLLQYTVVGGMPNVVKTFVESRNLGEVLRLQQGIVEEYKSDMLKYAPTADKPKIRKCFESIPAQLSRENKKFTYSGIQSGARAKDYDGSLQWIEDAGIIRRCRNLQITELPLDGNAIDNVFKVYMADTGLFVSMLEEGTQTDIICGNLLGYKGAIFENLAADIFGKMGRRLYYFRKDSGLEIDFVIRYRGKCVLVECKANTGHTKSARTILAHPEKYHIEQVIKLGDYNIGQTEQILTLPLYMTFLLTDR